MKAILFLFTVLFSTQAWAVEKYYTQCKRHDCFKFGWITTGENYVLDTVCKNKDCAKSGWSSKANDQSTYDVTCKANGCFVDGWSSLQEISGVTLHDEVTCNNGRCLTYGWTVLTGYDLMGGNVTCHQNDCSKYGGYSFWRGRDSHTSCDRGDCYHRGWMLYID